MFGCLHACLYLYVDRMLDSQRGPPATSSVLGSPRCAQVRRGLRRQALLHVRHRAASLLDAAPVCYTQPVFHTCTPPSHVRYFQSPSGSKLTHDAARRARYGGRCTSFTPALLHSQPVLRALYVHHASSSRACIRIRSFHNLHCIPQPALYSFYSFLLTHSHNSCCIRTCIFTLLYCVRFGALLRSQRVPARRLVAVWSRRERHCQFGESSILGGCMCGVESILGVDILGFESVLGALPCWGGPRVWSCWGWAPLLSHGFCGSAAAAAAAAAELRPLTVPSELNTGWSLTNPSEFFRISSEPILLRAGGGDGPPLAGSATSCCSYRASSTAEPFRTLPYL